MTLVHEMTHVYQYQTGGWGYAPEALWAQFKSFVTTGDRGGAYDWEAADGPEPRGPSGIPSSRRSASRTTTGCCASNGRAIPR